MTSTVSTAEEFVAQNVPQHSTLASALLEYAARQRGLDVERFDPSITLVTCSGTLVPFTDLNGPDTSRMGELLCAFQDGLRSFLAERGIPVASSSTFLTTETKRGLKHADQLGWPVNVRPARLAGERGVTLGVADPDSFRTAWQTAVQAYGKQQGFKRVLVERHVAGERLSFFVVGQDVVSVTRRVPASVVGDGSTAIEDLISQENAGRAAHPYLRDHPVPTGSGVQAALETAEYTLSSVPAAGERVGLGTGRAVRAAGELVDVTDDADLDLKSLAVRVVDAIPGLCYAEVTMIVPESPGDAGSGHVVDGIDSSAVPVAHFPTHGQPRDVAGAIVDWYLNSPRWPTPRELSHTAADGEFSAVEPLLQGGR